jgi:hypothetical protein
MKMINFKTSRPEAELIIAIAKRAVAMANSYDIEYAMLEADMDISACHCNGNPLDLHKLLEADDFNFAHDVFGIRRHIDRTTGQLQDCFVPRCTQSKLAITQ